jgi:hypothetical protein
MLNKNMVVDIIMQNTEVSEEDLWFFWKGKNKKKFSHEWH